MTFYAMNQATRFSVLYGNPEYGNGSIEIAAFYHVLDALHFHRETPRTTVVHMGRVVVGNDGESPVYK